MHHQHKRKTPLVVISCTGSYVLVGGDFRITPTTFPSPFLFPNILALIRVSSASQLVCHLLGCTPKACKPRSCPASRPKKEPRDSERDNPCFVGQGDLTCLKEKVQEQHPDEAGRKAIAANFATGGVATIYMGN